MAEVVAGRRVSPIVSVARAPSITATLEFTPVYAQAVEEPSSTLTVPREAPAPLSTQALTS